MTDKSETWEESAGCAFRMAANAIARMCWEWCESHGGHEYVTREAYNADGKIVPEVEVCQFCGYERSPR